MSNNEKQLERLRKTFEELIFFIEDDEDNIKGFISIFEDEIIEVQEQKGIKDGIIVLCSDYENKMGKKERKKRKTNYKTLLKLEEKYKNKFWKVRHGYGMYPTDEEMWDEFYYCKEIEDKNHGIFDFFKYIDYYDNPCGKSFGNDTIEYFSSNWEEITQEEYMKELDIFKNKYIEDLNKLKIVD